MIRTRLYRDGKCHDENFDPARISDHLAANDGSVVWLDLETPGDKELALIGEEFGLNPLAVEDAATEAQRPKLDHYDDHVFISLYDVSGSGQDVAVHEFAIFAAPSYLITVRKTSGMPMDEVLARWDDNKELAKHGVGFLLWGLLDVVVDRHFTLLQSLDDEIEALEDVLFEPKDEGNEIQRRTYGLRKTLAGGRRVVAPTREIVNALMRRETGLVDDGMMPYYQDVYDHILRASDWADSLRDLVSSLFETHLTLQGNRMNEIMKAVTSWAAIAAVPAIITGYYGMNVRIFPAAGSLAGGIAALVLMAALVAILYVAFRGRDWL
jgi:magnesium transporter